MGDEKKKGGSAFKKLLVVVLLIGAAFGGWFAYATYKGDPDTCLCTKIMHMAGY